MSYAASSALQKYYSFSMYVFIFLSPPPCSVPLPFGTSDAQKKLIDAFLMRILGHKLNAIYCGKWQMRKAERWRGRGIGLNLGQAAAAAVVVAFEK